MRVLEQSDCGNVFAGAMNLPYTDRVRVREYIGMAALEEELNALLNDCYAPHISEEEITAEVEQVRQSIYDAGIRAKASRCD